MLSSSNTTERNISRFSKPSMPVQFWMQATSIKLVHYLEMAEDSIDERSLITQVCWFELAQWNYILWAAIQVRNIVAAV